MSKQELSLLLVSVKPSIVPVFRQQQSKSFPSYYPVSKQELVILSQSKNFPYCHSLHKARTFPIVIPFTKQELSLLLFHSQSRNFPYCYSLHKARTFPIVIPFTKQELSLLLASVKGRTCYPVTKQEFVILSQGLGVRVGVWLWAGWLANWGVGGVGVWL